MIAATAVPSRASRSVPVASMLQRTRSTTSASVPSSPTLPANTTYGMPIALGVGLGRAQHGDHPGQQLAEHLGAADAEPVHGDVVRGDPALGDHPAGPGLQRRLDHLGHGLRHPSREVEPASASSPPRACGSCRAARPRRASARATRSPTRRPSSSFTSSSISISPQRSCAAATCRDVRPTCEPTTTRPWPSRRGTSDSGGRSLQPGQRAHERRPGAVEQRRGHSPRPARTTASRSLVGSRVDDHPLPVAHSLSTAAALGRRADVLQRQAERVAAALLGHEVDEVRGRVAERGVLRELRLAHGRRRPRQCMSPRVKRPASKNAGASSTPS